MSREDRFVAHKRVTLSAQKKDDKLFPILENKPYNIPARDLFGPFTGNTNGSEFEGFDAVNSCLISLPHYIKIDSINTNRNNFSAFTVNRNRSVELQTPKPNSALDKARVKAVKTPSEQARTIQTPKKNRHRSDFSLLERSKDASTQSERNSDQLIQSDHNQPLLESQPQPIIISNKSEISPESYFRRGSNAVNMLMLRFKQKPKEMYLQQTDLSMILAGHHTIHNTPKEESIILLSKEELQIMHPTSHQIQHNLGSLTNAQKNTSKWEQKIEIHKSGLQRLIVDPNLERRKKFKRRFRRKLKDLTNELLVRKESLFGKRFKEYCEISKNDSSQNRMESSSSAGKDETKTLEALLEEKEKKLADIEKDIETNYKILVTVRKIALELKLKSFHIIKAPSNYYQLTLEQRRDILKAPSIEYLCKSLIMENTAFQPEYESKFYRKYYCICLQYVTKLNSEKIAKFLRDLQNQNSENKLGKKSFNIRMLNEKESCEMTGYEHNEVTPYGMKTNFPIILSERIANLVPKFFYLGAGAVDLKLRVSIEEFRDKSGFEVFVGNIVYD